MKIRESSSVYKNVSLLEPGWSIHQSRNMGAQPGWSIHQSRNMGAQPGCGNHLGVGAAELNKLFFFKYAFFLRINIVNNVFDFFHSYRF